MLAWMLNLGSAGIVSPNLFIVMAGAPTDILGVNNDVYLDKDTGLLYKKVSGTWQQQGELWWESS